MKKRKRFFYNATKCILLLGISQLVINSYNFAIPGSFGGGGGGGIMSSQCKDIHFELVTLFHFKLNYNSSDLRGTEAYNLRSIYNIHNSPIFSLAEMFNYNTGNVAVDARPWANITVSSESCKGAVKTSFRSRYDFPANIVSHVNIPIKYDNIMRSPMITIEIATGELDSYSKRRLIWTKSGNSNFFSDFDVNSTIHNPPALVYYSAGGDFVNCDGECNNWNNDDIYIDGGIDEEMAWSPVVCTCN